MSQMRVFVSHSHEDDAFCHALVQALQQAGADVWYDEHNMGSGRLSPTIEREVRERPVFVVILSPAALHSPWVEDETRWAYGLLRKDPSRLILPVTAATIQEDDIWLFLQDFKRIEAPGVQPLPLEEAVLHTLQALALTSASTAPAPVTPQPGESVNDLMTQGRALVAQKRWADALPLFQRATERDPANGSAWAHLGWILNELRQYADALPALNRALALGENAPRWANKTIALRALGRVMEAEEAERRAKALRG